LNEGRQLDLFAGSVVIPSTVIPQGDGSFVVRAGKPVAWLKPRELAAHLRISPRTVYKLIEEGTIPPEMVRRPLASRVQVSAAAIDFLVNRYGGK
jgi:excisionase family DNA binding protein